MKNAAENTSAILFVADQVMHVPISMLVPDPDQPRREFDQEALAALAADIRARGVENPLIVRSDYVIKHGERRWRAAKLAGLQSLPCLLAPPAADERPDLERELDQVTNNHHQQQLKPMEWARFLRRLVEHHQLPVGQIPAFLEKRGVTMSRPYISNLMRLVELPEWAQAMMNSGRLTASHGKHLLPALRSEKVLKQLRADLERPADGWNSINTSEELEDAVADAFHQHHFCLDRKYGDDAPLFDAKECGEHCPCFFKLPGDANGRYCLNDAEFKRKQDAARGSKGKVKTPADKDAPPAKKIEPAKNGIVNLDKLQYGHYRRLGSANFDIGVCKNCEHNKLAARGANKKNAEAYCFNVPEFEQKQRAFANARGRRARVADYFDGWVRAQLIQRLSGNYDLQFQIVVYMALGLPGSDSFNLQERQLEASEANALEDLPSLLARYKEGELPTEQIAVAGIHALDRENLYHLARYAGVVLLPTTYRIDAAYLDLCKKSDIASLVNGLSTLPEPERWDKAAKGKLTDMKAFCLLPDVVDAIGVPPELAHLYANMENPGKRAPDDDYDYDDMPDDDPDDDDDAIFSGIPKTEGDDA